MRNFLVLLAFVLLTPGFCKADWKTIRSGLKGATVAQFLAASDDRKLAYTAEMLANAFDEIPANIRPTNETEIEVLVYKVAICAVTSGKALHLRERRVKATVAIAICVTELAKASKH